MKQIKNYCDITQVKIDVLKYSKKIKYMFLTLS